MSDTTTVAIPVSLKEKLESLRVYPKEPIWSVVARFVKRAEAQGIKFKTIGEEIEELQEKIIKGEE